MWVALLGVGQFYVSPKAIGLQSNLMTGTVGGGRSGAEQTKNKIIVKKLIREWG
jgi:hypothetical protein